MLAPKSQGRPGATGKSHALLHTLVELCGAPGIKRGVGVDLTLQLDHAIDSIVVDTDHKQVRSKRKSSGQSNCSLEKPILILGMWFMGGQ